MSNMAINTNVLALNSHRSLKGVGAKQEKASTRLSSGYRINSAADDAAGLAISEKMRAQIKGLDMASKNAQDGISLIQTAEGGMQEIDNMLQRIRELTVQVSNDTNEHNASGTGDRQKIQDEINQLVEEIDSMSDRIEFNKKKVINGDYANYDELVSLKTKELNAATDELTKAVTTQATANSNLTAAEGNVATLESNTVYTDYQGAISTYQNAKQANDAAVATYNDKYAQLKTHLESADFATAATKSDTGTPNAAVALGANPDMAAIQTWAQANASATNFATLYSQPERDIITALAGTNMDDLVAAEAAINTATTGTKAVLTAATSDLAAKQAAYAAEKVTVDGKTISHADALSAAKANLAGKKSASEDADKKASNTNTKVADLQSMVTKATNMAAAGSKSLWFQVGANSSQGVNVNIGKIKSDILGIGDGNRKGSIDVLHATGDDINATLDTLDSALSYVTTERSKLGALQNRMEYSIKSLDISSENLTAAESRIRDTDMAKEMMNFTQSNVLQQAATSMLAQANQSKQGILQLLK